MISRRLLIAYSCAALALISGKQAAASEDITIGMAVPSLTMAAQCRVDFLGAQ